MVFSRNFRITSSSIRAHQALENMTEKTEKTVSGRPFSSETVLNHLVVSGEVGCGPVSNISMASTFRTERKGPPLCFSRADYSYSKAVKIMSIMQHWVRPTEGSHGTA